MAQQVKDPASSLLWLGSLVWCGFDPWYGKFCMPQVWPKKLSEELSRHFSKEKMQMDKKHTKWCSISLIIEKYKSKPQWCITSHLLELLSSKKNTKNKCWQGCGEKGILIHCWWECKLVQPLWKILWKFLKKLKIELSCDPTSLLLENKGVIIRKNKNTLVQKDTHISMFIAVLFTIANIWNNLSAHQQMNG